MKQLLLELRMPRGPQLRRGSNVNDKSRSPGLEGRTYDLLEVDQEPQPDGERDQAGRHEHEALGREEQSDEGPVEGHAPVPDPARGARDVPEDLPAVGVVLRK